MSGQITIELDSGLAALAPGAAVTGRVRAAYVTKVRSLRLRLALVERTRSYDRAVLVAAEVELAQGPLTEVAELPFSLTLPADAFPGGEAQPYGRVGWELRAWADVPGRDPDAVVPLLVSAR